ncbi:MAG: chromosome segregation protein SMC [Nitrospirota bacterium]
MRIERVELVGFKSFAEKTVFKFHPGMTGIVGPNGCGKSNIVDAFKWVLGEQSAKSLRGGKMEDVIFAGSATMKTRGMAEVTLVLSDIIKKEPESNGSGEKVEKNINRLSVTRRLYRSGESEYMMNKVPCRLKDIRNMFLDTGLELKAYSILEQGRIGDIVNSKPLDRRFLIEEVAGVMKYKVRKHEAKNKLELSKTNLQRLQDIVAEVKRQINTVDRHAKKAERYKKLHEEIMDIDLRIAKRDLKAFREEINGLASSEETLKSREAEVSANYHATEALIEEKKLVCVDQERALAGIRTGLYSLEKETTEDEGKIALLKSECNNLRERYNTLDRQENELDLEKENTIASVGDIEKGEIEMTQELTELHGILEERKQIFSTAERERTEIEHELEDERRNLFNKAEEISNTKNEINHLTMSIDNISRKAEKNSQDMNTLSSSLSSLNTSIEQMRSEHLRIDAELQEIKSNRNDLTGRMSERKTRLADSEKFLYAEREGLAAMGSRLESLQEMDRSRMAMIDESIKTLCQVADIFDTPPEYETAMEAILGDKLAAAVVENNEEITKALQHIKEQNTKRSGFITVHPVGNNFAGGTGSLLSQSSVIGEAAKFVSVREGFDRVAAALLNDVLLVDNLDTALSIRERPFEDGAAIPYMVTLEGEVIEPSGMIFAGTDKGVLKIKRMVKELENEVKEKKAKIAEAERMVETIKEEIISTENEIISLDGRISSQEKYSHGMEVKLANFEDENSRLQKKQEYITHEINDDHREKDGLKNTLQEKDGYRSSLENGKLEIEEKIRVVQNTLSEKRETLETMRSGLTEIKLNLASANEKMASVKREISRLNESLVNIDQKKVEIENERKSINEGISNREQEVTAKEDTLKLKIIRVSELQSEASSVNEILESKTAELALIEKQEKELAAELEKIRSELSHVEMKKMEQSMKLNYMVEDISKTYSVEIETVDVPDNVTPEEEEKLPRLKERLQAIGPVSLGTLDEYEELKERFAFLTKQRDDLLQSIDALEDTIRKINRTTKKRLEDAFEALNEKFKEVFKILLNGKAELQLTEGSILDAGIEIVAQPPGKRLQNLNLLSGGEKAMTALSLLFAGFMIKPTPLCLLDEVDAPLDESNTVRFLKLLKELSTSIQFIAITHNRRTMEASDYLYGITMEEPGSSKVVSMHLSDAEMEDKTEVETEAEEVKETEVKTAVEAEKETV